MLYVRSCRDATETRDHFHHDYAVSSGSPLQWQVTLHMHVHILARHLASYVATQKFIKMSVAKFLC